MHHYGLFRWKGNCYYSFTDVFVAVTIYIYNKVSFDRHVEYFKNFSISGAQLKEAGY